MVDNIKIARVVGLLAIVLSLAACGESQSSSATALVERAKAVLRSGVGFDPKAAQFRNVYVVQGNVVCGEINWQDASQQYRGFVPFIYRYGIDVKDESGLRSGKFAAAWMRLCEARPVTSGQRAELPQHQQEDFAQRLRKLKAAGGNEEPAEFRRHYWQDLAEIEQDLDPDRAAEVERKATKENAQAAEEADKIRKQLGK